MLSNKVLKRQLKKLCINESQPIDTHQFQELLKLIEQTYEDMDNNVYRLERALDISTKELHDLNENLAAKVQEEVKKNREKDEKLLNQSRFASMGEMIGNIAHQWRQPLSAISSTSSGMMLQLSIDIAQKEDIEQSYKDILGYTDFLSQTIDDFRNFLTQNHDTTEFNVSEVIFKTLNIVSSSFHDNGLNIYHDEHLKDVEIKTQGYFNELSQVFLNLFNNARDASISKNEIANRRLYIGYEHSKNDHIIFIQDNAGGIPSEIINKIFDPYFTTKHQKQGTGIGLYMSRKIIESFGGEIFVLNKNHIFNQLQFDGACFYLKLPKV